MVPAGVFPGLVRRMAKIDQPAAGVAKTDRVFFSRLQILPFHRALKLEARARVHRNGESAKFVNRTGRFTVLDQRAPKHALPGTRKFGPKLIPADLQLDPL